MPHSALAHLPPAAFALAPELATVDLPIEERATCDACPVAARPADRTERRPFHHDLKCCTFHPDHPNWLVGRALRRGGVSAAAIRARLTDPAGVSEKGIAAPEAWNLHYRKAGPKGFGRTPALRCPYLAPQGRGCTIWKDRGHVCRTWFCRHVDGDAGRKLWTATLRVLVAVEHAMAYWCVREGDPPDADAFGDPDRMAAWFIDCADRLDAARPTRVARLRDDDLDERIEAFTRLAHQVAAPMPLHLGPRVRRMEPRGDGLVSMGTMNSLEEEVLPTSIFQLFSRLDGRTPWPDALREANDHADPPLDAALVHRLYKLGLLEARDPENPDHEPGTEDVVRLMVPSIDDLLHAGDAP